MVTNIYELIMAAEAGNAKAQYDLGVYYSEERVNSSEAIRWFIAAAKQGYVPAQTKQGWCYERGFGVKKDYTKALECYKIAATQGDDEAKEGVERLEASAARIANIKKKAEAGDAEAQYELGDCYYNGIDVVTDNAEAFQWWQKAAGQGYVPAQYELGSCYSMGIGVTENVNMAIAWYRAAAEQGYVDAQVILGGYYEDGEEVPQDLTKATYWYTKAAEQGDDDAKEGLKRISRTRTRYGHM